MILEVIDIVPIRAGVWGIIYTADCGCGCKYSRHILAVRQLAKPSDEQANQLIDADYNK